MSIRFVTTHKKIHIAALWGLPDCGAPDAKTLFFDCYRAAVEAGKFPAGTEINFCIPAVSRGLFSAACEAKQAGLPVSRVIAACNENRVLTDFFRTGRYVPAQPARTDAPLLDVGAYPETAEIPEDARGLFAAYSIPARRRHNMAERVLAEYGVRLAPSTAAAYVALQDHRCVTADGLHAILFALEEPE
ncbi:MAG: pyridoxal-phosphate dependent enzyme [Oscillospiraceae bacterium]|nr:pyridoxal-phosphate dependent enzyme [Oscillospiraceae bacterium]